ncbi:MAG: type II toxin-antitoxin system prevent-host-death family antitoxin [Defluviicoccus sp.]|nr:MAG: type II toxin-antitoxin system prevent-host-death family antitoxin [Defluviicoccus sp.]
MREVGTYEAKTHLPELLKAVETGETIVITRRGTPSRSWCRLLIPRLRMSLP